MTFNEFNSRINLPEICRHYGFKRLEFVKVPSFGWFAISRDKAAVMHLFQMFPDNDVFKLYREFCFHHPDFFEFTTAYSERIEQKLYRDYLVHRQNLKFFKDSRDELATAVITTREATSNKAYSQVTWEQYIKDEGLTHLQDLLIGIITPKLMNAYPNKPWPKFGNAEGRVNHLLFPTFCTPNHVCSLEAFDLATIRPTGDLLFINKEKGWYGDISSGVVLNNPSELYSKRGFTWDYKCDSWTEGVLKLPDELSTANKLKIFTEARNSKFLESPIAGLSMADLEPYLHKLSKEQVRVMEQTLNISLTPEWTKAQRSEVQIGNLRFVKEGSNYLVTEGTADTEYTNFVMDIVAVVKAGKEFFRKGVITYQEKEYPFILPEDSFQSAEDLQKAIHLLFLEMGIGLPYVYTQHKKLLLDVINRFSPDVKVIAVPSEGLLAKQKEETIKSMIAEALQSD